jgi:hypothetical protein
VVHSLGPDLGLESALEQPPGLESGDRVGLQIRSGVGVLESGLWLCVPIRSLAVVLTWSPVGI